MPNSIYDSFQSRIHELQHQAVRDLAWCCFSPPIMSELPGTDAIILPISNDQHWVRLSVLDQKPDKLLAHIAQVKSTRLGIYYETLWHFYFSQQPEWELLHHNLQVERDGITLGAFDFLCRNNNEYWHIETAVKFYLCNTNNAHDALNWNNWIGPSSQDRLDLKLTHLAQHQLPLHQAPEAIAQLHNLHPEVSNWKTGLCLQGYLFSPATKNYHPEYSQKNHDNRYWWHLQDFLPYLHEHMEAQWIILERQRWLSPAHCNDTNELIKGVDLAEQLQKQIGAMKRPLLLAAMTEQKLGNNRVIWRESWRGFVVPDTWPKS